MKVLKLTIHGSGYAHLVRPTIRAYITELDYFEYCRTELSDWRSLEHYNLEITFTIGE